MLSEALQTKYDCLVTILRAMESVAIGYSGGVDSTLLLKVAVDTLGPRALAMIGRLHLWKRATSLGGVESLIEHRASVEGPQTTTPPDLLRLSVGLEDSDDLISDLESALGAVPPAGA